MQIFEKSILKLLKHGCRTQYDLSIISLSLAGALSAPPLRFARNYLHIAYHWVETAQNILRLYPVEENPSNHTLYRFTNNLKAV